MGQESSSPPSVLFADVGWRLSYDFFSGKAEASVGSQASKIRTKCGFAHTNCVRLCDLIRRQTRRIALRKTKPCLDLRDLGTTDGNPVGRRTVELDNRSIALLPDEGDGRDGHNVAA